MYRVAMSLDMSADSTSMPSGRALLTGGIAYTGKPVPTAFGNIILNCNDIINEGKNLSILYNHDPYYILGQGKCFGSDTKIDTDYDLYDEDQPNGKNFKNLLEVRNHPFQLSVHVEPTQLQVVGAEGATVNGQFVKDVTVYHKIKIEEVSLVAVGRDSDTTASNQLKQTQEKKMSEKPLIDQLNSTIEKLQAENEKLCACKDAAEKTSNTFEDEIKDLKKQVQDLKKENDDLKAVTEKQEAEAKLSAIDNAMKAGAVIPESLKQVLMSNSTKELDALLKDLTPSGSQELSSAFEAPKQKQTKEVSPTHIDALRQVSIGKNPDEYKRQALKHMPHTS